jgi:hypothetical protein
MSSLFEAKNLKGRAVNVEIGVSGGRTRARWDMEIVEGEHKGRIAKYSGKMDPDNIKWTKRDMMLIGWQGQKSATFVSDVKKANKVVEFEAQIARNGDSEWVSARFGGATPLAALDSDKERELDRMFAEVPDETPSSGNSSVPF